MLNVIGRVSENRHHATDGYRSIKNFDSLTDQFSMNNKNVCCEFAVQFIQKCHGHLMLKPYNAK